MNKIKQRNWELMLQTPSITRRQKEAIKIAMKYPDSSLDELASIAGVDRSNFTKRLTRAERSMIAYHGVDAQGNPDGISSYDRSTLFRNVYSVDDNGNRELVDVEKVLEWKKEKGDRYRLFKVLLDELENGAKFNIKPKQLIIPEGTPDKNKVSVMTLTDLHIGNLVVADEWLHHGQTKKNSGTRDWNTALAEQVIMSSVNDLIKKDTLNYTIKPNRMVLDFNGDFLHYSYVPYGGKAVTEMHGHILDNDGFAERMIETGYRIILASIEASLEAGYENVDVIIARGNHDATASSYLRKAISIIAKTMFAGYNVNIVDQTLPYYCIQEENLMLGFAHGDIKKKNRLNEVFSTEYAVEWGKVAERGNPYRVIFTGHYHSSESKDENGCEVFQCATLVPKDTHSSFGGYTSQSNAQLFQLDKFLGKRGILFSLPIDVYKKIIEDMN